MKENIKELLRKQRELCAKHAIVNEDYYRGRFQGCSLDRQSILNAPEPQFTSTDSSADNQTSQIADKDEKEELSRLKEENERLRSKA